MKIKNGFILRPMGDEYIAVAVDAQAADFNGMIKLNGTGAFIWQTLEKGCTKEELVKALTEHYDVDEAKACEAADAFVARLKQDGFLDE